VAAVVVVVVEVAEVAVRMVAHMGDIKTTAMATDLTIGGNPSALVPKVLIRFLRAERMVAHSSSITSGLILLEFGTVCVVSNMLFLVFF
jgi:hypothetical protein